jgi:hypothetical protein
MDKQNFNQTGGFPLKTERLADMQASWSIFNQLGYLGGNLTIVTGCIQTGNSTGNGFVFISGEIYPFEGGSTLSRVKIIEEKTAKEFENGTNKDVVTKLKVVFTSTEVDSYLWSSFTRLSNLKTLQTSLSDLITDVTELKRKTAIFQNDGGMFLWNKPANQIPPGFAEVVEWRGRIPVGFDNTQTEFNEIGKIGGAKDVQLTANQIPELVVRAYSTAGSDVGGGVVTTGNANEGALNIARTIGGNEKVTVLNPYRVIMFIEYVG